MLSIAALGVLALFVGYRLVHSLVIQPRNELLAQIAEQQRQRDDLELWVQRGAAVAAQWQSATRRTLGAGPDEAIQAFRDDVNALLKEHDLTEELRITPRRPVTERKGPRRGFTEVTLAVDVKGTLQKAIAFLSDLYQRPYFVRVDTLTLNAGQSAALRARLTAIREQEKDKPKNTRRTGRSGPGGSPSTRIVDAGDDEPLLAISMSLSTLVLPVSGGSPHPTLDLATLAGAADTQPDRLALDRIRRDAFSEYDEIVAVNMFKVYVPPPPPPPKDDTPTTSDPVVVKQPPLDPWRDAKNFRLVATVSFDGQPLAYILDGRKRSEPADERRLNEELFGGRIVLISPEGIVVRCVEEKDGRSSATNYFCETGATLDEREELTAAEHPDVWRELQSVLERAEGRAARPSLHTAAE